jgi:hypothetical protein
MAEDFVNHSKKDELLRQVNQAIQPFLMPKNR